jgi:methylated-DNA-[protein]-cysteine S-methyltransferase
MVESEFQRMVYEKTREIPKGRVSTYIEIARAVGRPKAFRAVGNALNRNPYSPSVPCHRVIRSNKSVGGFARGAEEKKRLLEEEGVLIADGRVVGEIFKFDA